MATAAISPRLANHRDAVFASVFPPTTFTTPTPESTPNIGVLASPGGPFGGFSAPINATDDAVRYSRAWSTATRYLSIPLTNADRELRDQYVRPEVQAAFVLICSSPASRKELVAWYGHEISGHFRQYVLPQFSDLQQPVPSSKAKELLNKTLVVLDQAQRYYLGILAPLFSLGHTANDRVVFGVFREQIRQGLHLLVMHSLPKQRLQKVLASVLYQEMKSSLHGEGDGEPCCHANDDCQCLLSLQTIPLSTLQSVGLGGNLGERAFAHAVHKLLEGPAIDRHCFRVDWTGQTTVVPMVRRWVATHLCPFIEDTLIALTGNIVFKLTARDMEQFAQMAIASLGRHRIALLFDYIKSWPESKGALLDIKEHIASSTAEKAHLCSSFVSQIQQRLLHAGASTTEVLSIYTNVIHAFRLLDARGVLLEKVAVPIRNYLRARDDTVSIIAASFLQPLDADGNLANPDLEKVCPAITAEVSDTSVRERKDHKMMNWGDMQWMPDPIDAGPEYRASKSEDVLAYILGLFDQEEFIKEATTVLAQHLLSANDPEYVRETWLIELFKSRLDATKLQAAEVMLKDVRDSVTLNRRMNPPALSADNQPPKPREIQAAIPEDGITGPALYKMFEHRMSHAQFSAATKLVATRRQDLYFAKRTRAAFEPVEPSKAPNEAPIDYKVQVLSSFFWPQMRANDFALPVNLSTLDEEFGSRFRLLGNQRKLHVRRALARVTVELQLEDRHIKEVDVPAWRASVIDAFAAKDNNNNGMETDYDLETGLTLEQLTQALEMEEDLALDAVTFWLGKRVLYQPSPGLYAVLERLDMDTGPAPPSAPLAVETVSAVMSQDAMLRESQPMFETFILGMLRDGGPKEVGGFMGVTNLLKMVLPTFTYGEEEVRWLLGELEARGLVVRNGEVWAVS